MAIFAPNSPLAGFNVGTGSLQGPSVVLDSLTGASTPTFLIAGSAVGDQFFISASNFNVKANGNITASNALLSGTITATAGFIGGWTIGSTTLTGGSIVLDSTGKIRTATNFTTGDGFYFDDQATNNFRVGLAGGSRLQFTGTNIEIYSSNTRVVSLGTTNDIAGFGLTPSAISSSNNQLVLRSNGQITGSNVLFSGGRVGGFTISGDTLSNSTNFFISGSATNSGTDFFISSSRFNVKGNGDVTASSALFSGSVSITGNINATTGNIGGFAITANAITGSGFYLSGSAANNATSFFISSSRFNVKGNGDITGSNVLFTGGTIASFTLSNDALTAGSTFFISSSVSATPSTAFFISSSRFNIRQDGTISGSNVLFNGGRIGGFSIDATKITGSNIIIDSAGSIQTSNYATDLAGWKIDAAGNGTAEFENVKIRGTLSTAVFEKQSVNAVGGQLYVANSTVLTGSGETGASTNGQYSPTQATMSVENATGFEIGEILSVKKFSGAGFATEYMQLTSASRANPTSQTDFSGRIYVTRGLGNGIAGNSSSLGETPSAGQSYSGSQVIVSTGKLGTGFIRINANPNDTATPYIDIVERTGSGIYDVALKARLGDLSGLANSSYVFGRSNPGFGLATDNVFLQGGIIANTGSIGGISMESGKLFTGVGTFNNSNTGFYIDNTSYFSLGNKLSWDGIALSVSGTLNATDGNIGGFAITRNAITGSAFFISGSAANNGTSFFISSSRFNVKGNGDVTASSALFSGSVNVVGNVNATAGSIGGFNITTNAITGSGFFLSGSATGDGFFISSSKFNIKANGNITGSSVLLDGGTVGGFQITSNRLYTSTNLPATSIPYIELNATNGVISGSNILIQQRYSGTTYQLMNTEEGFADFKNLGRQVVADSTEYTRTSTTDEGTSYTNMTGAEWIFNVLPGETNLKISWNQLAHSVTHAASSRVRWQLQYLAVAQSGSAANSNTYYDNWTNGVTSTHPMTVTANSSASKWEVPNSTVGADGANFIVDSYQGSVVKILLQLANDINNATGNMTTKIKGVSAYTTRTYGAAASSGR